MFNAEGKLNSNVLLHESLRNPSIRQAMVPILIALDHKPERCISCLEGKNNFDPECELSEKDDKLDLSSSEEEPESLLGLEPEPPVIISQNILPSPPRAPLAGLEGEIISESNDFANFLPPNSETMFPPVQSNNNNM